MRIRNLLVPIITLLLSLSIVSPSFGLRNHAPELGLPLAINQGNPVQELDSQSRVSLFDRIAPHKAKLVTQGANMRLGADRSQVSQDSKQLQFNVSISVDAPTTVAPNGEITYSLQVTNGDSAPITEVYIYSYVPDETTFVRADEPYEALEEDGTLLYWYMPQIDVEESIRVSFTVRAPLAPGEEIYLDDYGAEYMSQFSDPDDPDDFLVIDGDFFVTTISGVPDDGNTPIPGSTPQSTPDAVDNDGIGISVSGPAKVSPGGQITYELVATNSGTSPVEELYILNFVPDDTLVEQTSQNFESEYDPFYDAVAWYVGTLAVGSSVTVDFTVRVPDLPGTTIYNDTYMAVFGSVQEQFVSSETFVETLISGDAAAGEADLNLTVSATHSKAGDEDLFEIVLKNTGSSGTSETFYVDLYIDPPKRISRGGRDWSSVGSIHSPVQGLEWVIEGIGAGQEIVLTSQSDSSSILSPDPSYTNWSGQLPTAAKTIYIYVDSWAENESTNGLIREGNEQDNLAVIEIAPANPVQPSDPSVTAVPLTATPSPTRLPTVVPTPTALPEATPDTSPDSSPYESSIDFRSESHGYTFENWGGTKYPDDGDLNAASMIRMFGAANVCQSGNDAASCVLSAAARQWRTQRLKSMQGGHCYGMAVTSQRFYSGSDSPGQYQSGASTIRDLQPGTAVRANVTEFAISQSLSPADGSSNQWVWKGTGQTPSSILELIRQRLRNNPTDPYVLGFFQQGRGGHAVTPYAIEDKGNGIFWLYFYDNNWPDQPRYMIFNTVRDTWVYEFASLNPSQPSDPWAGDARTDSLVLRPTSAHLTSGWACPFCQSSTNVHGASVENESVVFMLMGEGEMLVVNGDQKGVGYDFERQQFINNVTGSEVQDWIGGLGVDQSPILRLPQQLGGEPYKVYIAGKTVEQAVNAELLVSGPGFVAGLSALQINPGEDMLITISADAKEISFTASEQGTFSPDFFMALDPITGTDSYIFGVGGFELDAQKQANVSLDLNSGLLSFSDNDGGDDTYAVEVVRVADDGTVSYYSNDGIQLGSDSDAALNFGAWNGSGDMNVAIDGEDQTFANEGANGPSSGSNGKIFLPVVTN